MATSCLAGYRLKNGSLESPGKNKKTNRAADDYARGLKSIPPLSARRQEHEIHDKRVDVVYPSSMIDEGAVPTILQRLATERDSLHRKRLIWSVVGMPIAAPFGLVPVIPNIPFFYLAYRGVGPPVLSPCPEAPEADER